MHVYLWMFFMHAYANVMLFLKPHLTSHSNPSLFDWPRQSVPPPGKDPDWSTASRGQLEWHCQHQAGTCPFSECQAVSKEQYKAWAAGLCTVSHRIHLLGVKYGAVISPHVLKGSKMFRKIKDWCAVKQKSREKHSYYSKVQGMWGSQPSTLAEQNLGGPWASALPSEHKVATWRVIKKQLGEWQHCSSKVYIIL